MTVGAAVIFHHGSCHFTTAVLMEHPVHLKGRWEFINDLSGGPKRMWTSSRCVKKLLSLCSCMKPRWVGADKRNRAPPIVHYRFCVLFMAGKGDN